MAKTNLFRLANPYQTISHMCVKIWQEKSKCKLLFPAGKDPDIVMQNQAFYDDILNIAPEVRNLICRQFPDKAILNIVKEPFIVGELIA